MSLFGSIGKIFDPGNISGSIFKGKSLSSAADPADLFGTRAAEEASSLGQQAVNLQKSASAAATELRKKQQEQADIYEKGVKESLGANASDYMALANQAAQAQAAQAARYGTTQASKAALQAARSAGVNRGQAALTAAQQAAGTYGTQYQTGLESGRNQYQQGAQLFQNQANAANQNVLAALNAQANVASGQQSYAGQLSNAAQQQKSSGIGAVGAVAGMFSDERLKTDVKKSNDLDAILAKIRPVDFKYKPDSGLPPEPEHKGVMAQDLEGTSLENAVKETEDGTKIIDSSELAPGVLNLVIQLADRVRELERGKK